MGGDVRNWTGVRSPTPHKVLRAHERRVQGDGSYLPGGPLAVATQIGVGRRVRCPNKNRANLTLDKWGFALVVGQEPRSLPIRGAPTMTPLRTSSTATLLGLASKDAPR